MFNMLYPPYSGEEQWAVFKLSEDTIILYPYAFCYLLPYKVILFAFLLLLVADTEYYNSLLFHVFSLLIHLQEINIKSKERRSITKMHLGIRHSKMQYTFTISFLYSHDMFFCN
jgi:hypothetical protein